MFFHNFKYLIVLTLLVSPFAKATQVLEVAVTLDNFHQAAAEADSKTYFNLIHERGVFIGTDASERWSKNEFERYAQPYFSQGKGWLYAPRDRHIMFTDDGNTAWFDEMLDHKTYGVCRGTGVLSHTLDGWKIMQYHLTFPLPNDKVDDIMTLLNP